MSTKHKEMLVFMSSILGNSKYKLRGVTPFILNVLQLLGMVLIKVPEGNDMPL